MHIVQRGINRAMCFDSETDHRVYLSLLRGSAALHECALHAYVLMGNHVHLLVTPAQVEGTSAMMKHLGQQFVQYVNRSRRRTGALWEGRFRSSLVDSTHYLLRCHRYIELNPVRAVMVLRPEDYQWSSYRANAWGLPNDLVTPHPQFEALGTTGDERRLAYRRLFDVHLTDKELAEIRSAARGGFVLGGVDLTDEIESALLRPARRRRAAPSPSGSGSPKAE